MTEALTEVLRFGFEKMHLNRIECVILPANKRSIRLIQRIDFKKEGLLGEHSYFDGNFIDDVVFPMLTKERIDAQSDPN